MLAISNTVSWLYKNIKNPSDSIHLLKNVDYEEVNSLSMGKKSFLFIWRTIMNFRNLWVDSSSLYSICSRWTDTGIVSAASTSILWICQVLPEISHLQTGVLRMPAPKWHNQEGSFANGQSRENEYRRGQRREELQGRVKGSPSSRWVNKNDRITAAAQGEFSLLYIIHCASFWALPLWTTHGLVMAKKKNSGQLPAERCTAFKCCGFELWWV